MTTPSLSHLLKQQEQTDLLRVRVEVLEQAVLLLAKHVGAVGWNYELQQVLNQVRDATR